MSMSARGEWPDGSAASVTATTGRPVLWCGASAAALCLLYGCAVGPNFHRPAPPAVEHYVHGGDPLATATVQGLAQRFTPGARVAADWWRLFNSGKLDELVTAALAANPSLKAAQASLRESEDNLRSGYGIFYPHLDAAGAASRQRNVPIAIGLQNVPSSLFNLFTVSGSVSYALDLFGGQRRLVEALGAGVDLQRAGEQATYLTLLSNIVNAVVARAAYHAEVNATAQLISLAREQVRLAQVQAQAGTQPYSTVLSLQSQLASYQASIPQLEQKAAQSEDLLATLVGEVPAAFAVPDIALTDLTLPSDLPVRVPSDLVRQRPDIVAAEATAHAASANIGIATAAMLPNVTLSGAYSANATRTSQLFAASGRAWSAGASVIQPLFEGGTLWFKRKAAVDAYQQTLALYRQAVLTAFQQVADTLRALDHDAAALAAEDEALQTSGRALHLVQTNYAAGLNTYLDVLNADAQYHQAQIAEIEAVATRYQDTVALYVALGGGWWNVSPPLAEHSATAAAPGR
jgi:NodT family efflux transporter outer membrane factor (OMF) lipoprotein